MAFNIYGQMRLGLQIGDPSLERDFPINPSLLDEITIIQNNLMKVPTITLTIHDGFGIQESQAIFGDGSQFSIAIGWEQEDEPYRTHPFRVYSLPKQIDTDQGLRIQILGYLDIPQYFRKRVEQTWDQTSSQLISRIAEQNSLTYEVDGTDDQQIWLPDGRNFADYARFVTNHGWANVESCMELAITQIPDTISQHDTNEIPWMLRYLDLTKKIQGDPSAIFFNTAQNQSTFEFPSFTILELDVKNHSGFFNNWVGYGNRIGQQQLDGTYDEYEPVEIYRSMDSLELNRELKDQLGIIRREVAPIDCGNTHSNFITAYHQNRRIKSLYATTVDVLVLERTSVRLFDKVRLLLDIQQSDRPNETYQGDYLVTGKSISIAGGFYREKFELAGQGSNNDIEGFRV